MRPSSRRGAATTAPSTMTKKIANWKLLNSMSALGRRLRARRHCRAPDGGCETSGDDRDAFGTARGRALARVVIARVDESRVRQRVVEIQEGRARRLHQRL